MDAPATAAIIAEVAPHLRLMCDTANRHDVDGHVGCYARDPTVTLVMNGVSIVGWESIREKQVEWWQHGKTKVVYTPQGEPIYHVLSASAVISTLSMKSQRPNESGQTVEGFFVVSSVWCKRPEGWRVIYAHESTTR